MDVDSLRRMRTNIAKLFPTNNDSNLAMEFKSETPAEEASESPVPASLLCLATYRALGEIHDLKKEILPLENDLRLKPFLKGFDKVQSVVYNGAELWNEVAKCLQFLYESAQIVLEALKDPMKEDALPLPHHLHSQAIQTIEHCNWMIQQKGWQPLAFEVDWEPLLLKLQQEVSNLVTSSKNAEKHFKEVEDFKHKLDTLLKNLSSLRGV